MTVTIGAGSAKTVLEVGKTENGDTYARDAVAADGVHRRQHACRPILKKPVDDYRKKELFEFRHFYLATLRACGCTRRPEDLRVREGRPPSRPTPDNWKVHARGRRRAHRRRRRRWTICWRS